MRTTRRLFILAPVLCLALLLLLSVSVTQAQFFGTNWIGEYYTNPDLSGSPFLSKIDQQVNFNFGDSSPVPNSIPADGFSVRWRTEEILAPGIYRFYLSADDGARAYINDTLIMDFYGNTGTQQTQTADYTVSTNAPVRLTVEYADRVGTAIVQFFWEPAGFVSTATAGPSPTPTATGLPPIPAGALTATVIRASVLNIRDAPSLGGGRIGRILRGQTYQVVGRDTDARWFLLELGGGRTGWAYGYYLFFNRNEFTAPVRSATTLYGLPSGFNDTGVLVQALAGMKLRAAPDIFSEQTGRITWGSFLPVVGRTAGGDWYQVLWKGTIGWVFTGYLKQVEGDLNNVPVVN